VRPASSGLSIADDRRGAVAVVFALAIMSMVGMLGLVIDYGVKLSYQTQLNNAADAAALAAIEAAQADIIANQSTSQAIAGATSSAGKAFQANAGAAYALVGQAPSVSVTRSGQTFNATVSYAASAPTAFGHIFGINTMAIGGTSSSSVTMGRYLSFYLLLDVSESMGIPSTASDQNRLATINPDQRNLYPTGCTLACHFTTYAACQNAQGKTVYCQGYNLSRTAGGSGPAVSYCQQPGLSTCIQLRVDAVAYAVQQLMLTAQSTELYPNQFAVGLYPFAVNMATAQALTTNLTALSNAATQVPATLDDGDGSGNSYGSGKLGSGGTHFENALQEINSAIASVGDGSSQSSLLPFVFLVTDGAEDVQTQDNGSWSGSNHATTLNQANCTTLKNRGITLSILYIPYVPIQDPNPSFAGDEDDAANNNIVNIPPSLQSCASPGFFFTASAPSDITAAMQAMFEQSLQAARLTQ